jgi:hypothetical protein
MPVAKLLHVLASIKLGAYAKLLWYNSMQTSYEQKKGRHCNLEIAIGINNYVLQAASQSAESTHILLV